MGCEERTKGFFLGMFKKSSDFFGYFKYEPLSHLLQPPPPVIIIYEWGPWASHNGDGKWNYKFEVQSSPKYASVAYPCENEDE